MGPGTLFVQTGYSQEVCSRTHLPDEVERVMEEAHTINMSVLCNRRTYTQLCQHLVTSKEHCAIAIHCTVLDLVLY